VCEIIDKLMIFNKNREVSTALQTANQITNQIANDKPANKPVNFLKNIGIGFKILVVIALFEIIFVGVAFGYILTNVRSRLVEATLSSLRVNAENEVHKIESFSEGVRSTVLSISNTPPFQGIIRAQANGGLDQAENSTLEQWRKRMASIFTSQMKSTGLYDQMRYIDETGQEIVRVDYVNGAIEVIPDGRLQNKKDRDYFLEASEYDFGRVYISHAGLNREGNPPVISEPHKPVIRYAVPVFDEISGDRKGIVVANVLLDELIAKSYFLSNDLGDEYVVNAEGYYFIHPDSEKEWGEDDDLGHGANMAEEFPEIAEMAKELNEGLLIDDANVLVFSKAVLDPSDTSRTWTVIEEMSTSAIFGPINTVVRGVLVIGIGAFTVLLAVLFFAIKRLLNPLKELSVVSENVGKGDLDQRVIVRSNDEIGKLAVVFNSMTFKLKGLYENLEAKVRERTEELSRERDRIKTILGSIGDGVFVVDSSLNIVMANEVAQKLSGYTKEEMTGKKYTEVLRFTFEDSGEINDQFIKKAIETGQVQGMTGHTVLTKKDGAKIAVGDSAAPLKDKNGAIAGVVVVFRDISKEREVDRMKTEFLSVASHQLRTPLGSMRWNMEILLSGRAGELPDKVKQVVQQSYNSNLRLVDLVNNLLDVSRIEQLRVTDNPEETDLVEVIELVIKEMAEMASQAKIKINLQVKGNRPKKVIIDPDRWHEVVENLISNAIKYNRDNGQVTLIVETAGDRIKMQVIDEGIGIPANDQSKIFSKFYRAENAATSHTEGSGLGLSVVKSYVEAWGGSISFESEENKGTTFTIELPFEPKSHILDKNLK